MIFAPALNTKFRAEVVPGGPQFAETKLTKTMASPVNSR